MTHDDRDKTLEARHDSMTEPGTVSSFQIVISVDDLLIKKI